MSLDITQTGDANAYNVWNKPATWNEATSPCSPSNDIWSAAMVTSKPISVVEDSSKIPQSYSAGTTTTSNSVIGSGIGKMNGISNKMSGLSLAPGAAVTSQSSAPNGWIGQASTEESRPSSLGTNVWSVPSTSFGGSSWSETPNSEVTSPWSKSDVPTDASWTGGSAFWSSEASSAASAKGDWFNMEPKIQSSPVEGNSAIGSVSGISRADTPTNTPKPSGTPSSIDIAKSANEEALQLLINTTEKWGKKPVDQSTPWNVEDMVPGRVDRNRQFQTESNVWRSEPPTGTGIWEAYYESMGKKPAHWQQPTPGATWDGAPDSSWSETDPMWNKSRPPSGWISDTGEPKLSRASSVVGSRSVWGASSSVDDSNWVGSETGNEWVGGGGGPRRDSEAGWNMTKGESVTGANMWTQPPPANNSNSMYWADGQAQQPPNGRRIGNGNRMNQMRVHAIKHLVDLGFKKEDAQSALIKHNMDIDRAITELRERAMFPLNGGGELAMSPMDEMGGGLGGPRSIRGCGPNGPGGMMGPPPPPPMPQAAAGQQMMRQQIMAQLRTAVQKKHVHPSLLKAGAGDASMSTRDLQVYQQIMNCQQEEATLKQRLQLVSEQLQSGSGGNNPLLSQQYELGMNRLRSLSHQLAAFNNKLSSQAKLQQQRSMPPSRSGMPPGEAFMQGNNSRSGPPMNRMESWQMPGNQSDFDTGMNFGRSMSMQPDFTNNDMMSSSGWEQAFFPGGATNNNNSMSVGGPQQQGNGLSPGAQGAVDVAEFVPGRPWQGVSSANMDDPAVTPASARSLFASVNNDRLEKLAAVSEANGMPRKQWNGSSNQAGGPGQQTNIGGRNWGGDKSAFSAYSPIGLPTNGQTNGSPSLMIRNLTAVSAEFARSACQNMSAITFVPNPQAGWAVALFSTRDDALRALRYLSSNGLQAEPISEQDTIMAVQSAQRSQH